MKTLRSFLFVAMLSGTAVVLTQCAGSGGSGASGGGSGSGGSSGSCAASCTSGCCDSAGKCQAGNTSLACGKSGATCQACSSGQLCQAQACTTGSSGGGSGSTGGGSGSTGGGSGSTGGGSGSTGGGSGSTGGGSGSTGGGSGSSGGGTASSGGGSALPACASTTMVTEFADGGESTVAFYVADGVNSYVFGEVGTPPTGTSPDGGYAYIDFALYPKLNGATVPGPKTLAQTDEATCDYCFYAYTGCDDQGQCEKVFLAQSGSVYVARADQNEDAGVITASGTNMKFYEWDEGADAPVASPACLVLPTYSMDAGW
ncbi:MAG: hypothetical protein K1X89_24705 [Myxococcaceae bacterium]|nr:hypothetical protein [Myxococcaceae bacterium]